MESASYSYQGPFEKLLTGFFGCLIFLIILGFLTLIVGIGMIIGLIFLSLA